MVAREDLQKKYAKLETVDLLEIFANKPDYTQLAVDVAHQELKKRNISETEINNYRSVIKIHKEILLDDKSYLADLAIWQKVTFYFIWIPRLRWGFTAGFSSGYYVLKTQQADYYSIVGFCMLVAGIFGTRFYDWLFPVIWLGGIVLAYLFDVYYNRARQIRDFDKKMADGKMPGDF